MDRTISIGESIEISIDESATMATPNERLEALKARYVPTPNNQQQVGDGDLNKTMDRVLYVATKEGDVEKFVDALEEVSESRELALSLIFDQVTPSGNSLLHVAASSGKDAVMELILIHFPYLVTRKNSSDDTPLHVAVQDGRLSATRMLISRRRDSDIIYRKNKDSKSPLYLAVENCKSSDCRDRKGAGSEILQLLLKAYARDEDYAVKTQGMSPVLATLEERGWESDAILREIVKRLPKLLHVRDENGGTPLHSAASVGNFVAVQVLLEKCPYLALQTDKNGSYPIHNACEGGSFDTICHLINYTWPDLAEIKNNKGQNILHVAAKAGNADAVSVISEHCKDAGIKKLASSKDSDGNTPVHLASMHKHLSVLRSLMTDNNSDLQLLNNDRLNALESGSSPTDEVLQGGAIPIEAGVRGSIGQDLRSTSERSSGPRQSSHIERMQKEIDTRLVVATLVASVTFTAGLTLPGGYNGSSDSHPGTATMLHNKVFHVFIISDALATYSSIFSVIALLQSNNPNCRQAENFFDLAGPLLSAALTFMTVAFSAALILAVMKLTWLVILLLCVAIFCLVGLYSYVLQSYLSSNFFPHGLSKLVLWCGLYFPLIRRCGDPAPQRVSGDPQVS